MERVRKSYGTSEGGCSYKNESNKESHPCKNIVNKDEIHESTAIVDSTVTSEIGFCPSALLKPIPTPCQDASLLTK